MVRDQQQPLRGRAVELHQQRAQQRAARQLQASLYRPGARRQRGGLAGHGQRSQVEAVQRARQRRGGILLLPAVIGRDEDVGTRVTPAQGDYFLWTVLPQAREGAGRRPIVCVLSRVRSGSFRCVPNPQS